MDEDRTAEILFVKERFKQKLGYELNLDHPQTIQEKVQWIKIYGKLERFARYTDKYEVRQFIKESIGSKYLIPLLGVYEDVDDIDFDVLPPSFVLKATHGSTWNIIVKDKSNIDWNKTKERMRKWLNKSWYEISKERNYKDLKGRVIIQKNLQDPYGRFTEYKFHSFHGIPKFFRTIGYRGYGIYDMNGNPLNESNTSINRPKRFDEMVAVVRALSRNFAYVRVDLFDTIEGIYFGELTFAPGSGFLYTPKDYGLRMGSLLDLKRYI